MSRLLIFQCFALPILLAACSGCGTIRERIAFPSFLPEESQAAVPPDRVRQSEWWEENKDRKVFVPGRGYQIEGVEGYFDEKGRPIDGAVQQASFAEVTDLDEIPDAIKSDSVLDQLDPTALVDKVKAATGQGPNKDRAKQLSVEGDELFRKQDYDGASEKYEQAAARWPGTNLAEDSLFMQAESHFFADEYPKAVDAYQELIKDFPSTRHLDKVMRRQFDIAQFWQKTHFADEKWPLTPNFTDETQHWTDTIGHAVRVYDHIRINDPTGPLADQALMATATAYFVRGHYSDADYHFGLVRREYANSEFQYQAHLLGLQCKLKMYQGPDYDGTVLDEADKIAEQLLKQFPQELAKNNERERVSKLRQELAAQQALRLWTMAKYYEGRSQYGAARTYWNKVVDKYPGTKLAHEAKSRLSETQSEPARPERKTDWLVELFDQEDKPTAVAGRPQNVDNETKRR